MDEHVKRKRLETEAIVVGYAMSRLDMQYLASRGYHTWKDAFRDAATSLLLPLATFKNLRDEFDPLHGNLRKGWHRRPLRQNRQRVYHELCELSDDALLELVGRILNREEEVTVEAIDSLAAPTTVVYNVAERLLTGRRAEEYFIEHCYSLLGILSDELVDMRQAATGYDFGIRTKSEWAIEVKGLKKLKGEVQFTDREWREAEFRSNNYWLVIIGNLIDIPKGKIIQNPHAVLSAYCIYQQTISATWRSSITI